MISGIYQITNKENGKIYVGQSKDVGNRWRLHLKQLKEGIHHNSKLQLDYNKYGYNNFTFEILEICKESELNEMESHYINNLQSFDKNIGYNIVAPNAPNEQKSKVNTKYFDTECGKATMINMNKIRELNMTNYYKMCLIYLASFSSYANNSAKFQKYHSLRKHGIGKMLSEILNSSQTIGERFKVNLIENNVIYLDEKERMYKFDTEIIRPIQYLTSNYKEHGWIIIFSKYIYQLCNQNEIKEYETLYRLFDLYDSLNVYDNVLVKPEHVLKDTDYILANKHELFNDVGNTGRDKILKILSKYKIDDTKVLSIIGDKYIINPKLYFNLNALPNITSIINEYKRK